LRHIGTITRHGLPDEVARRPQVEGLDSRPTSSCGAIRRRSSASPDLQNEFVGAVIGAMDASEDLSAQMLNYTDLSQKLLDELAPIVYRMLKAPGQNVLGRCRGHCWHSAGVRCPAQPCV
jgi:hypothetical protein